MVNKPTDKVFQFNGHANNTQYTPPTFPFIQPTHLSPAYASFLANMSIIQEPTSYREASTKREWIEAMQLELDALEANKTWETTVLPKGKRQ